jgi:hypothetical protein
MKKVLLFITLLIGSVSFGQIPQGINYQAVAYDSNGFEIANQEISIRLGILLESADTESSYTETHQITTSDFGLFSLVISQGNSTDDFSSLHWENGAFLKVELDEDLDGDYTLLGINSFSSVPYALYSTFAENIPTAVSNQIDSLQSIVDVVSQYFGCTEIDACNYDATAIMSDSSCMYAQEGYYCSGECIDTDGDEICDLAEVEGCTDTIACNYVIGATNDDGSCEYNQQYYNCQGDCENDSDGDGICDEIELGCMDNTAGNYNPMANQDDGSCIPAESCPYPEYLEYDSTAASFNTSLCQTIAVYDCMDHTALNYNAFANVNQDCECENGVYESSGYCIINGCTDISAGNYNSLANADNGTCLSGGCVLELAENYNPEAGINDGSCIVFGCILEVYPNYNMLATVDDGSCDMSSLDVFGCTDSLGYNYATLATMNNGECLMLQPGELVHGGMVFYVDETGQHGLVAAMEDLGQFEWGCYSEYIDGADGTAIGTGYQNTLDIVTGCSETTTAAFNALNAAIQGYTDWYLPSKNELIEMYYTIGNGVAEGNIGGFSNGYYWSSSENSYDSAWLVSFSNGNTGHADSKDSTYRVGVIRAF